MPYDLNKEFYSPREAAKFLGLRPIRVLELCHVGELDFLKGKDGKPLRISKTSILARARQNAEEAKAKANNINSYKTGNYTKLLV